MPEKRQTINLSSANVTSQPAFHNWKVVHCSGKPASLQFPSLLRLGEFLQAVCHINWIGFCDFCCIHYRVCNHRLPGVHILSIHSPDSAACVETVMAQLVVCQNRSSLVLPFVKRVGYRSQSLIAHYLSTCNCMSYTLPFNSRSHPPVFTITNCIVK